MAIRPQPGKSKKRRPSLQCEVCLFLGLGVGRGLNALSWVGEYPTVPPGRGEQLAHSEQNFVLHGIRSGFHPE